MAEEVHEFGEYDGFEDMPGSGGSLGDAEEVFRDEEIRDAVNEEERFGEGRLLDGAVVALLELKPCSV